MKKYYDTKTGTETHIKSETTIDSTDERVKAFFEPLKKGYELKYDENNLPILEKIPELTEDEKIKISTDVIKNNLMTLCDTKQDEAEKLILGYKATPKQLQRYQDKYTRAKAGEFDEATNSIIIAKHEEYVKAIRNLVDLIEYFRSAVDDLISAGELDRAGELIEAGESFGATTKLEDIKALLGV